MSLTVPFYWVDAFTDRPFGGNPAAVCILDRELSEDLMQTLAFEFGLSETAFVWPKGELWGLRWFTPNKEVRLCGHATVGAATALWAHQGGGSSGQELIFDTLSGKLTAKRDSQLIELCFPSRPPTAQPIPNGLCEAVSIKRETVVYCGNSGDDYLVVLPSLKSLQDLNPDFRALEQVETRGTIFTTRDAPDNYDIASRFFAPRFGVDEDPVTGSAHCCLAPYWAQVLGKSKLQAIQLSQRQGKLEIEVSGDRVYLRGQSVLICDGRVNLPT